MGFYCLFFFKFISALVILGITNLLNLSKQTWHKYLIVFLKP